MTSTLDDVRRAEASAEYRAGTVTMLQDAAGSGQPVMVPGTRESRLSALPTEPLMPSAGYNHEGMPPLPDRTGPIAHLMMSLVDRLIALMRVAPSR